MVVMGGRVHDGGSRAGGGCTWKGLQCWWHEGGVMTMVAQGRGHNGGLRGNNGCARESPWWWCMERWWCGDGEKKRKRMREVKSEGDRVEKRKERGVWRSGELVWERGILNVGKWGKALEICREVVYREGWKKKYNWKSGVLGSGELERRVWTCYRKGKFWIKIWEYYRWRKNREMGWGDAVIIARLRVCVVKRR